MELTPLQLCPNECTIWWKRMKDYTHTTSERPWHTCQSHIWLAKTLCCGGNQVSRETQSLTNLKGKKFPDCFLQFTPPHN